MLDIKFIRDNLELCKNAAKNKNRVVEGEKLLQLDDRRRELIRQVETLRAERNEISSQSAVSAKGRSAFGGRSSQLRGKEIKGELKKLEEELRTVEQEFTQLMYTVPNVPDKSVPVGKDSTGNVEIKKWGEPTKFSFKPKDHIQLAKELDLIDFERGVKVGGYRAYFLKNEAALLEMAILMYAYQKLVKKGYIPLIAPSILNEFTLFGIGQFPWGREEVYHLEKDDKYLAGTAEQPVTAYFANEILNEKDLPKKFVAFSPCFRREAGSYGKDTKGAYRVHQFNKIEQVIISTNDMSKSF